ncbi:MAG: methyltransferase [Crocinitomicaceae bacterium]|nr:methyltransferase [Crocinitomicaceae bacterium]
MAQDFQFKHFTISQNRTALKVGTDSMLLGALTSANNPKHALDLGAGTGVLSLMLCQKFPTLNVDAIEIDKGAFQDCLFNLKQSSWSQQVHAIHGDYFNHIFSRSYDLIVSNPPFYLEHAAGMKSANELAKHTSKEAFAMFISVVKSLLTQDGTCWIIIPHTQLDFLVDCAKRVSLYINQIIFIDAKESKPNARVVVALSNFSTPINTFRLVIRNEDNSYSDSYINLTKEFHSKELKK